MSQISVAFTSHRANFSHIRLRPLRNPQQPKCRVVKYWWSFLSGPPAPQINTQRFAINYKCLVCSISVLLTIAYNLNLPIILCFSFWLCFFFKPIIIFYGLQYGSIFFQHGMFNYCFFCVWLATPPSFICKVLFVCRSQLTATCLPNSQLASY